MFIHSIFRSPRIKSQNRRGRRPRAGCRLLLESLENRTPLSSGIQPGMGAAITAGAAEIVLSVASQPPTMEWVTVGTAGVDQADPALPQVSATTNAPPLTILDPTPASQNAPVDFLVNAPVGVVVSPTNPPAGPVDIDEPIPAPNPGSAGGVIAASPLDDPSDPSIPVKSALPDLSPSDGPTESESDPPPIPETDPFIASGPAPWRTSSQASIEDQETDMSYAGTLENIETADGFSPSLTTPLSSGRTTGRPWGPIVTEPQVQADSSSESPGMSGLSYLVNAGWSTSDSGPSSASVDDALAWEDNSTEPILPASITAGGVSLKVLLGGPDVSMSTDPRGVEQVAELVPLPETSLALAATLWTVAADSRAWVPRWNLPSAIPKDPATSRDSPSAWALFVTGMDEALEQTCRDIREGIQSGRARQLGNEIPSRGPDDVLEWQGPILPATRVSAPRPGLTHFPEDSTKDSLGTQESTQSESDNGRSTVLGVTPVLSVVSISAVIAGWFWRDRRRLRRPGLGGNGSRRSVERVHRET